MSSPEQTVQPFRNNKPTITVMVCHDCCCGTSRKHPGVDHDEQRATLLDLADDDVRVRVVDCLDVCARSNVVLVRDLRRARHDRDTWLGDITTRGQTEALAGWIRARCGPVPDTVASQVFDPRAP